MASFTSIFSSPSPFQDVVDSATSELLMNQDWTKTFEIIDTINRDPSCSADMVKAIKKRVGMKKTTVIIRSLQLIDALVKNCSFELHKAMSDQWFSLLEKLAIGRRGPEVQNESLLLIQRCGKAFKGMQREAPMFYRLYETLRAQNVRFPVDDEATNTAMLAPPKAVIAEAKKEREIAAQKRDNIAASNIIRRNATQQQQRLQQTNHVMSRADAISKLQKELAMVEERAKRFKSLKLAPGSDVYLDEVDFLEQCHIRLQELVASISQYAFDEKLLSKVLNINDIVGEAIASSNTKNNPTIKNNDKKRSIVTDDDNNNNDNKNLDNDLLGLSDLNIGVANISTSSKVTKNIETDIDMGKSNDKNVAINISNSKNAPEQSMISDNPFDVFVGTTSTYGVVSSSNNNNSMIDSTSNNDKTTSSNNNATAAPITNKSSNDDMLNDFFGERDGNSGGAIPLPTTDDNQNNSNKQQPLTKTKTDDLLDDFFS
jgi:hypothetical protein